MKTKSHLQAAQRRELEAELRAEYARMLRSVARNGSEDVAVLPPSNVPGGDISVGLGLALESRAETAADRISRAIQRLKDGTYGFCARCQAPIPYGRLIVLPATEYCVLCGTIS